MKVFLILLLLMLSFACSTYSYTASQMEDCISSSSLNPATKSISKESISNYCDCALKAIIDEKKDIRIAGYECALQNFN